MTRYADTVLAACAAFVLTLGSIGAIVTVPPAQAAAQSALAAPELA
ncbi:MAG: hypothetical protein NBV68_08315 [Erythrobacter sp.]|nr:hypothetical protein [Erythrobacter sp.]MCL9999371.1 hypothetical protein [Erythrobacter sp.]